MHNPTSRESADLRANASGLAEMALSLGEAVAQAGGALLAEAQSGAHDLADTAMSHATDLVVDQVLLPTLGAAANAALEAASNLG